MKVVSKKELKDLQDLIQSALSGIMLTEKIRLRILTPLKVLNFYCNKLMEEQYLFLSDKVCFEGLKTHLVSDLRSYLSQEDRSRMMNRLENKAKLVCLDHIYKETTTVMKHGLNPTLDECYQIFKIRKEKMEDIMKDLKNVKSTDELKSFKLSNLRFKKFVFIPIFLHPLMVKGHRQFDGIKAVIICRL